MKKNATNRGFTLIELLIALTIGVIVLSAALSFAVTTWRTVEGNEVREQAYRNGRFIGMSLERDMQTVGVGIASTVSFGTVAVWSDTIVILSVPFTPNEAPPHDLDPPGGVDNPLPPGGTCGTYCLDLSPDGKNNFTLEAGDLARLEVNGTRRLILLSSVTKQGNKYKAQFTTATQLLHYTAGLTGGLLLDRFSTFAQKLDAIVYYLDGDKLMRADHLNLDGTPAGEILAYGIQSWDVSIVFTDNDEQPEVTPGDSDPTNDFDDILAVKVKVVAAADRPHIRVKGGELYTRTYEWQFAPRNLMYERNRF